jgi:hypothetical protein
MYQVRFENSSLEFYNTFEEAFADCQQYGGWKISFDGNRWLKCETQDEFDEQFEDIDQTLISQMFLETGQQFLWINQPLSPKISHKQAGGISISFKVLEILTNNQLQIRYNSHFNFDN